MSRHQRYLIWSLIALALLGTGIGYWVVEELHEPTAYEIAIAEHRRIKDQYLRNAPQTPIPEHIRLAFRGLSYYPPNPKWRIKAAFERRVQVNDRPEIPEDNDLKLAGVLFFQIYDRTDSLLAYWQHPDRFDELFVPFRDQTNGRGSYAGGRYLNLKYSEGDSVILDFNKSYNPLCAYNPLVVCPMPPPENKLEYRIEAGEREFPLKDRL